ncbi:unnamed protein product [Lampetra fluviatilis]
MPPVPRRVHTRQRPGAQGANWVRSQRSSRGFLELGSGCRGCRGRLAGVVYVVATRSSREVKEDSQLCHLSSESLLYPWRGGGGGGVARTPGEMQRSGDTTTATPPLARAMDEMDSVGCATCPVLSRKVVGGSRRRLDIRKFGGPASALGSIGLNVGQLLA